MAHCWQRETEKSSPKRLLNMNDPKTKILQEESFGLSRCIWKKKAFFVCLFWQIAVCFQTLGKSVKYMEKIAKYIPRYMACILKWQRWRCGEAETCQAQTWKIMEPWTEGVNPNVGYSTTTGRQCEHWTSTGCKEEKNIKWKTESGLCVGDQSGWSHPSLSFDLVKGVTAVWNTNHGPAHNSLHPPS